MVSKGYTNISIPDSLIESINEVVGTIGYMSVSEFVKDACRRRLESMDTRRIVAINSAGQRFYEDPLVSK